MIENFVALVIERLVSLLLLYKYPALFLIQFLTALVLPLPASSTLVAAGAFSLRGSFNIYWVLLVALVGNIAGDATGFLLARRYGKEILSRIGFRRVLNSRGYSRFENYISDYPQAIIFSSRFLVEACAAVNLLSGLARLPYRTYFTYEILGETCYVILYGMLGFYLGREWENSFGFFTKAGLIIFSIGITINVFQYLLFRKRTHGGGGTGTRQ